MDKYKELIEQLRNCAQSGCSHCKNAWCEKCIVEGYEVASQMIINEAADAIEELLKVQDQMGEDIAMQNEELLKHEWVPVSERLPEEDYCTGRGIQYSGELLVTVMNHGAVDDVFVDMACTVDGKWQMTYPQDNDPDIPKWCEIIAWQPLPEPYGGEE